MEIARLLREHGEHSRRSILFLSIAAEEKGCWDRNTSPPILRDTLARSRWISTWICFCPFVP
jgi:hypothetical protein